MSGCQDDFSLDVGAGRPHTISTMNAAANLIAHLSGLVDFAAAELREFRAAAAQCERAVNAELARPGSDSDSAADLVDDLDDAEAEVDSAENRLDHARMSLAAALDAHPQP